LRRVARRAAVIALSYAVPTASARHAVATSPSGVDRRERPRKWDERIADLADFVERERLEIPPG
jgi:hypothetical protein